jgi:hypothetical protein
MDNELETRPQRIRHHLQLPLAGNCNPLTKTAGNTINELVPSRAVLALTRLPRPFGGGLRPTFLTGPRPLGPVKKPLNWEFKLGDAPHLFVI